MCFEGQSDIMSPGHIDPAATTWMFFREFSQITNTFIYLSFPINRDFIVLLANGIAVSVDYPVHP
jgi:hypothetical protein